VGAAWSAEIERRLRDFDGGRTTAISLEEFESRMRARSSAMTNTPEGPIRGMLGG
jgi:hypothetical protein